jgi:ubiquitin conjugation factor E4 B
MMDTPYFEKFMNSLINDLTFCFEEGLAKIQAISDFEVKQEATPKLLTKEDKANYKQNKSICRANFQLAGECLWNTKQISTWCKQAFLNEAFAGRIAQTMNFVLKQLVSPESTAIKVKNPDKLAFKPIELLADLTQIYTNLSEIEVFCQSVVKDDRSFKPEYLS